MGINMTKKTNRPMMPSIFFYEKDETTGRTDKKYIVGRYETEMIINGIYKDMTEVQVGKNTVIIKDQFKSDNEWWCEVELEEAG